MSCDAEQPIATERQRFMRALQGVKMATAIPHDPTICIMRHEVFEALHSEVSATIGDVTPSFRLPIVTAFDQGRAPNFYYNGVVCVRAFHYDAPFYTFA